MRLTIAGLPVAAWIQFYAAVLSPKQALLGKLLFVASARGSERRALSGDVDALCPLPRTRIYLNRTSRLFPCRLERGWWRQIVCNVRTFGVGSDGLLKSTEVRPRDAPD